MRMHSSLLWPTGPQFPTGLTMHFDTWGTEGEDGRWRRSDCWLLCQQLSKEKWPPFGLCHCAPLGGKRRKEKKNIPIHTHGWWRKCAQLESIYFQTGYLKGFVSLSEFQKNRYIDFFRWNYFNIGEDGTSFKALQYFSPKWCFGRPLEAFGNGEERHDSSRDRGVHQSAIIGSRGVGGPTTTTNINLILFALPQLLLFRPPNWCM